MRGPVDVHRLLLDRGIAHEIVHVRRRLDTADDLPAALGVEPAACVLLDVYETDTAAVAVLGLANERPDPFALAAAARTGSLRLAGPGTVSALTDCTAAYVAPVGLPEDLTVIADERLGRADVVYTSAGDCSTALKIHAADLLAVTGAVLAPLAAPGGRRTLRVVPRTAPVGAVPAAVR